MVGIIHSANVCQQWAPMTAAAAAVVETHQRLCRIAALCWLSVLHIESSDNERKNGEWLTWRHTVQKKDTPPARPDLCSPHLRILSPTWRETDKSLSAHKLLSKSFKSFLERAHVQIDLISSFYNIVSFWVQLFSRKTQLMNHSKENKLISESGNN